MNLRLSVWPTDPELVDPDWAGSFDPAELPQTIYFDFVKVYDYNYDTKDFDLRWIDEFDTLNTTRWEMGIHTFTVNYAHFRPSNAALIKSSEADGDPQSDGSYLALSITNKNDEADMRSSNLIR